MIRALAALAAVAACVCGAASASGSASVPPLPARWPHTLQIGMADSPGGAAALHKAAPFGFRYQYLAGGVNTGQGWSTWNSDGSFVTHYEQESWAHGEIPVFTYYQLLQSKPGGGDELHADVANLQNVDTMRAYWNDVELLLRRAKGAKTVIVHVEPDLWGYLEQANEVKLAAAFAQQWVRLRDQLAPNVVLAYHMSGWGTKHDIVYEDPPDATVKRYAAQSAAFYNALHARFDVAFEDFSDRDSGFYEKTQNNRAVWFTPADFRRHLLYAQTFVQLARVRIVAWQIPLGNTVMRAENDTTDHYQDNRVQWLLGAGSKARLRRYAAAGFAGFLFGRGADGNTCACDAANDGVTNPPPIDGNTRLSLSADDDGGYFKAQVRAYYAAGALPLP